jgi:hypothetical protein
MQFILIDKDGTLYIDPFTSKIAKFPSKQVALVMSFMLFDQQGKEYDVQEFKA